MSRTLQFKIELLHTPIPIWRRLQIRDDYRMDRFHQVLQIAMGWQNAHLHEFRIQNRTLAMTDDELMEEFPDIEEVASFFLKDFKLQPADTFHYLYDFGDGWEHLITVGEVSEDYLLFPLCIEGVNHCPPEDCGGNPGFTELLSIVDDLKHEEYQEYIDWLPENYDPYSFAKDQINGELLLFGQWHNKNPREKSTPWHQIE
ncbi:MAG: hypothetical protein ACI9FN_003725 [Saprospiraceae bacterium]|jgi:hypothetical protein